jgi:hypothetical protein
MSDSGVGSDEEIVGALAVALPDVTMRGVGSQH